MTEEFSWQKWRSKWAQARHFQCELLPRVYICKKKPSHFWHYFWYSLAKKKWEIPKMRSLCLLKSGWRSKAPVPVVFEYVFLYIKNTWKYHIHSRKKNSLSTSDFFLSPSSQDPCLFSETPCPPDRSPGANPVDWPRPSLSRSGRMLMVQKSQGQPPGLS